MKKVITYLLTLLMLLSSLSVCAFADDETDTGNANQLLQSSAQANNSEEGEDEDEDDEDEDSEESGEETNDNQNSDGEESDSEDANSNDDEDNDADDQDDSEQTDEDDADSNDGEESDTDSEDDDETDADEANTDETETTDEDDIQDEDADAEDDQDTTGEESDELLTDAAATAVKIDFSSMSNGWHYINDNWYYVRSGAAVTGWFKSGSTWYYLDPSNSGAMATGWIEIKGDGRYYMTSSGAMKTGWVYTDSTWYYLKSSGRLQTGWLKSGSTWYYLDPDNDGAMVTGWLEIEGDSTYYMNSSGAMKTGWVYDDSTWYYFQSSGRLKTGWLKTGGVWYYLDPDNDGAMATGWTEVKGDSTYYMNSSGAMQTGWVYTNSTWYYFQSSGRQQTGWLKIYNGSWSTHWYYLDPDDGGAMVTGWVDVGNDRYYMNSSGVMKTGWLTYGGKSYYLKVNGAMATGWIYLNDSDYYFYKSTDDVSSSLVGTMAYSTEIDGRTISSSGKAEAVTYDSSLSASALATATVQSYSSGTSNLIYLNRSDNKVYVFEGAEESWSLLYTWSCDTGASSTPTPSGTYVVQDRLAYFDSGSSRCFYATRFYGSYYFHTILYYQNGTSASTATVQDSTLGKSVSHGCVRLATSNAAWIYNNIDAGTTVVIY